MRSIARLLLITASSLLTACSSGSNDKADVSAYVGGSGAPASNAAATASGKGSGPACLSTTDVESALGFAVRDLTRGMQHYGPMWTCGFAATDTARLPGVTVTITIEPASEADQRFAEMRQASQMARRVDPDVIPLGERGMAYGMSSGSTAAAVKDGRLYSVQAAYGAAPRGFGDRKEGVTVLLRKLMGA
jgi:hypothetical protein